MKAKSRLIYVDLGCVYSPEEAWELASSVLPCLAPALSPDGSFFIHTLPEACAHVKVRADELLGRKNHAYPDNTY